MFARLALIFLAGMLTAQQPYSWRLNPPPVQEFSLALAKVQAAGTEPDPFGSIRGAFDPQTGNWYTISLPGSSGCRLVKLSGRSLEWQYHCALTGPGAEREAAYRNVQRLVRESRADWKMRPSRGLYGSSWFFYQDERSPIVHLGMTSDSLSLSIYSPIVYP